MSRKNLSFEQLIRYFEKEQVVGRFSRNLYSNLENKQELVREFLDNAEYIKQARGSVFMYHEVLSLQENDLSLERQIQILQELTHEYVVDRADKHLVYGVIHNDTDHLHMHLLISSNKVAENKRVRLSKKEFAQIQTKLEQHKNKVYAKELEQTNYYQAKKVRVKEKVQEQEMKHRRKKQTKKEMIREQLEEIFNRSMAKEALEKALKKEGFELYQRGKSLGITFENKNYRLKTLGLEQEYKQTLSRFVKREQRQEKRAEFKQERGQRKTKPREQERSNTQNFERTR